MATLVSGSTYGSSDLCCNHDAENSIYINTPYEIHVPFHFDSLFENGDYKKMWAKKKIVAW